MYTEQLTVMFNILTLNVANTTVIVKQFTLSVTADATVIVNTLRFKYTTKFSLPKIACPAIVYAEIVVVIDPFFAGVCP